jgi:hypothetical protein
MLMFVLENTENMHSVFDTKATHLSPAGREVCRWSFKLHKTKTPRPTSNELSEMHRAVNLANPACYHAFHPPVHPSSRPCRFPRRAVHVPAVIKSINTYRCSCTCLKLQAKPGDQVFTALAKLFGSKHRTAIECFGWLRDITNFVWWLY